MDQKYNAPIDKVFALLTDPKWLEARCLALGEQSAKITARRKTKKTGGGVSLSMTRRVHRDLPALLAEVLPSESDLQFEEDWTPDGAGGYAGMLQMDVIGQPITMSAEFTLQPAGKGCLYVIVHHSKCSIPFIGGTVAKFVQGQVEQGCADEFAYLVAHLKKNK